MKLLAAILGVVLFASCNPDPSPTPSPTATPASPIQHVVIIVQENRTVDNLFQGLPGADTQAWGLNGKNQPVNLKPTPFTASYDMTHKHSAYVADYAGGAMNGWNQGGCSGQCPTGPAFAYVPRDEIAPYWTLATTYAFADRFFQTNQGPSYPAHRYIVAGTSALTGAEWPKVAENNARVGCDSPAHVVVKTIDATGSEDGNAYPCFNTPSIFTLLDTAGLSWRYYESDNDLWMAPLSDKNIYGTAAYSNVITPPAQFLADIGSGSLAAVTWITPTDLASDHAQKTDGSGPAWVASVVDAIGNSSYWPSTAIFIVWDDWGGWYDHSVPPQRNAYELGFRVPLIVVSPYAKTSYVSHIQHEFGSILHYTESNFGLPSLGTTDALADDLGDMFDYTQTPTPFTPLEGSKPIHYWKTQRSKGEVDY